MDRVFFKTFYTYSFEKEIIFSQTDICDKVIYILEGIAASEYNEEDKFIISSSFKLVIYAQI
ncbi:hypothetical protein D5R40_27840 [Okeania hirsuta]|uniref:Uncharacterized protein n=1 Tax=Okeania hirsuta TaxID=1458930 RepID=A0A3N6REH8_9CYAN|nr:hypothetical protein D5R40_27840 [Okeania hirsuta]